MRQSARNKRTADVSLSLCAYFDFACAVSRRNFYHMQARSNKISAACDFISFLLISRLADVGRCSRQASQLKGERKKSFGSMNSAIISLLLFRRCLVANVETKNCHFDFIKRRRGPDAPISVRDPRGERKRENKMQFTCHKLSANYC